MSRPIYASIGLAVLFIAVALQPGLAQDHHGDRSHGGRAGGGHFVGGVHAWHGGNWHQGWHNGRWGWWWVVPGWADWYYYNTPVYPYPDPYQPPGVAAAGPGPYWYYCANPPGYYPYVARCGGPWQPVMPQNPG